MNALKHGERSAAAREQSRQLNEAIRDVRAMLRAEQEWMLGELQTREVDR